MENAKTALINAGENEWVDKFEFDSLPKKEQFKLEQELEVAIKNDWNLPNNSSRADAFLTKEER